MNGGDGPACCLPLLPPGRMMDPAGAGDAFAAGLTLQLNGMPARPVLNMAPHVLSGTP